MDNPRLGLRQTIVKRRVLRKNQTEAERKLWKELRAQRFANYKFRRQCGIGPYIVDFCSRKKRVIIEIDGPIHNHLEQRKWDQERQEELESLGYRVIRYRNEHVEKNLNGVLVDILEKMCNRAHSLSLIKERAGERSS